MFWFVCVIKVCGVSGVLFRFLVIMIKNGDRFIGIKVCDFKGCCFIRLKW